jgi:GxxExxY protein
VTGTTDGRRWTQMDTDGHKLSQRDDLAEFNALTERVIGCAFQVSNTLGCGFLEKVDANALAHELHKADLPVQQQVPIPVTYDGVTVGEYTADLVVDDRLIVELKVVKARDDIHVAQCINYLKATGFRLCLLINFGKPRVEIKRIAL